MWHKGEGGAWGTSRSHGMGGGAGVVCVHVRMCTMVCVVCVGEVGGGAGRQVPARAYLPPLAWSSKKWMLKASIQRETAESVRGSRHRGAAVMVVVVPGEGGEGWAQAVRVGSIQAAHTPRPLAHCCRRTISPQHSAAGPLLDRGTPQVTHNGFIALSRAAPGL